MEHQSQLCACCRVPSARLQLENEGEKNLNLAAVRVTRCAPTDITHHPSPQGGWGFGHKTDDDDCGFVSGQNLNRLNTPCRRLVPPCTSRALLLGGDERLVAYDRSA